LNIVHKNTEQIPEMVTQIALNKTAIEDMKPRVEKHDRMYRTALTLGGVGGAVNGGTSGSGAAGRVTIRGII
ncbi:MAG: hypothetical protein KGJ09_10710, partial [Candidatus Omnitrophica bacterium]|nr:hypothetical protein [Candidatus Omnitrophota bacterium]